MAASPQFKIYRGGEYVASVKYLEDAAAIVSVSGGVVKYQHKYTLWTEGSEEFSAGDSFDGAAEVMRDRLKQLNKTQYEKIYGKGEV